MKLPEYLHKYFWDVNIEKLDLVGKKYFVIQRLLDKGGVEAVKWTRSHYTEEDISNTFKRLRDFRTPVGYFWATVLNIPQQDVLCLQPHYLAMRRQHWPY